MASHITITPSIQGPAPAKGGNGPADQGGEDVFAALLGAANAENEAPATPTTPTSPAKPSSDDVNLALGFGPDEDIVTENPDLIAAAINATLPAAPAETTKPELTALIEGLANLKARLEAGETLDGKELERLDALLTKLAQQLDIDLTAMPTAEELTALLAGTGAAEDSFANTLTKALGPLASTLLGDSQTDASTELSAQIKAVGDKLAAILSALNQGDLDAGQLAQMQQDAATDTDLKAALDRLLKPTLAAEAAPALATPTLELKEATLTGKASAEATPVADVEGDSTKTSTGELQVKPVSQDTDSAADRDTDARQDDNKPAEQKPVATAAAPPVDTKPDTNAANQPPAAARVDIVAAPRVVQAGYQTSQQQLNLPQLAFEMVRQVSEGNTRFQIRLDPAELGRIDVRLDIDASGQVNARLTVEKAETLDLMQRDQKGLERALQQAGLDGAKTNLEFSLKQNPFSGGQQGQQDNGRNNLFGIEGIEAEEAPLPTVNLYRGNLSASGVNIVA